MKRIFLLLLATFGLSSCLLNSNSSDPPVNSWRYQGGGKGYLSFYHEWKKERYTFISLLPGDSFEIPYLPPCVVDSSSKISIIKRDTAGTPFKVTDSFDSLKTLDLELVVLFADLSWDASLDMPRADRLSVFPYDPELERSIDFSQGEKKWEYVEGGYGSLDLDFYTSGDPDISIQSTCDGEESCPRYSFLYGLFGNNTTVHVDIDGKVNSYTSTAGRTELAKIKGQNVVCLASVYTFSGWDRRRWLEEIWIYPIMHEPVD